MKTCLNCGRYGFAWWDKEKEFPFCRASDDEAFDLFEEELLIDRDTIEPGGDCRWKPKPRNGHG